MNILHPQTIKSALRKGYKLQVSQHSTEGLKGAFSLQCFQVKDTSRYLDYDIGKTKEEARKNAIIAVRNLKQVI